MNYLPDAALFLVFFALLLGFSAGVSSPARPLLYALSLPALGFLGVWATLFYLCGLAGWLQPLPFWIGAIALLVVVTIWKWRQARANFARLGLAIRGLTSLERVLTFYLALVWLLTLILGLAPPSSSDYDSLVYHLAVPAQWLRAGRISELPFDHHSYFPFVGEMLYALGLGLRGLNANGAVFARLFHWAMFVLGALILAGLGRRAATSKTAGLWAAVLFVSLPMAQAEATTAYVDLTFSAFAWAGIALFAEALFFDLNAPTRRANWLSAGVFCGLCLGSKYLGWLVFGFLGVWVLVVSLRDHSKGSSGAGAPLANPSTSGLSSEPVVSGASSVQELALNPVVGEAVLGNERWLRLVWLALPALLLGGFWYVRNALWTGNPVFPFAYGVFGGRGWTAQMGADYDASQAIYGFGHSPLDLVLLPWRLAMTPLGIGAANGQVRGLPFWPLDATRFPSGEHTGLFEVMGLFLSIFPGPVLLALGLPAFLARRKGAFVGFLAWLWGFLWAFWALSSQQVRYLFPALGLLCVLGGWVLATRIARFRFASFVVGACLGAWMLFAPLVSLWNAQSSLSLGVISGAQTPDAFLRRTGVGYDAMSWIGANTPPSSRVAVYGEPRDFYLPRPYFWADDGHNNLVDYGKIKTPAQLASALKALGATHVLVNRDVAHNHGVFGPPQPLFDQMVSGGRARLLYSSHGFEVYALN